MAFLQSFVISERMNNYMWFRNKNKISPYINRQIDEKYRKLSDMLMEWKMFPAVNKLKIKKYDGDYVNYSGVKFNGSPKIVFREFFEPYIEAYCIDILKGTVEYMKERNISYTAGQRVARKSLRLFADKFYSEMLKIDSSFNKQDKIKRMNIFINEQVKSHFLQIFWTKDRTLKIILAIFGIIGITTYFIVKLTFNINVVVH